MQRGGGGGGAGVKRPRPWGLPPRDGPQEAGAPQQRPPALRAMDTMR